MRKLDLAFALIVLLSGCASVPTPVSLKASDGQEQSYFKGVSCVQGKADASDGFILLSLCAKPKDRSRSVLIIRVANRTSHPVTIQEDAISARSSAGVLKVLAHTALMKEEKMRQTWATIGAAFAAASEGLAASNAGYSSYQGSAYTSATAYGSSGYAQVNASTTYSGTAYNGAAAEAARQRANDEIDRMSERLKAEKQMREQAIDGALRAHTIQPGSSHAAFVEIELPGLRGGRSVPVDVLMRLDGTETRFVMSVGS